MYIYIILSLLLLFSNISFSQEQSEYQKTTEPAPIKVQSIPLRPSDAPYPKELSVAGVQGTSELLATLNTDGTLSAISINQTSNSDGLDLAAIALAKEIRI